MAKVLLVEDDPVLNEQVESWLTVEHHVVELVVDGDEALSRLKHYAYDVIVLDWGIPGISGIDVLKKYRATGGATPILMLTGKNAIVEKQEGLDSGADDYLTKPFDLRELSARIRALTRRPAKFTGTKVKIADLELDTASHIATRSGTDLKLLPKEFALLELFMRNPNTIFSAETLLNQVWSSECDSTLDTVYTFIKTLRTKLSPKDRSELIKTVAGLGYKLQIPEEQ